MLVIFYNHQNLLIILVKCLFFFRQTVSLCQQIEKTGLSFLTVHGRTKDQKCDPVNFEAIKLIKDSLHIPVIANGDICSMEDAERVQQLTSVNGT